jgi:hypothetical protein
MKKANDPVLAGKVPFRARERCWPVGVPSFNAYSLVEPPYFYQTPEKVVVINQGGPEISDMPMQNGMPIYIIATMRVIRVNETNEQHCRNQFIKAEGALIGICHGGENPEAAALVWTVGVPSREDPEHPVRDAELLSQDCAIRALAQV